MMLAGESKNEEELCWGFGKSRLTFHRMKMKILARTLPTVA